MKDGGWKVNAWPGTVIPAQTPEFVCPAIRRQTLRQIEDSGLRPAKAHTIPIRRAALAAVAIFAAGAIILLLNRFLTPETVLAHYDVLREAVGRHFWGTMLAYCAAYVLAVSLSLPGAVIMTALGGLLFGWFWGGVAAVLSATIGGVILFVLAGTAFRALTGDAVSALGERLRAGLRDNAVFYLLFLRLAPIFPFWIVNLACAAVGVSLPLFATTTLFGIMPASCAFASAGAGLDAVVLAQQNAFRACIAAGGPDCRFEFSVRSLASPELLVGLAAMGMLAVVPVIIKRFGLMGSGHGPKDSAEKGDTLGRHPDA